MDVYQAWFNLRDGVDDLEFATRLRSFLERLQTRGEIVTFRLLRRKLGLAPAEFTEFVCLIETEHLAQLDRAFSSLAIRSGELDQAHFAMNQWVEGARFALYRDFPDPVRKSGNLRPKPEVEAEVDTDELQSARTVEALRKAVNAGARPKYLMFWGHTSEPGVVTKACLSQWYPSPFEHQGVRYATAEHFMMAGKARLFGDDEVLAQILVTASPGEAKALGRKVRGFEQAAWESARFGLVVAGSVAKFSSDPKLTDYLRSTGDRVLVEASPRDRIWGIGMGASNEAATDPTRWRGLNLLGFALMEARARL